MAKTSACNPQVIAGQRHKGPCNLKVITHHWWHIVGIPRSPIKASSQDNTLTASVHNTTLCIMPAFRAVVVSFWPNDRP